MKVHTYVQIFKIQVSLLLTGTYYVHIKILVKCLHDTLWQGL